MPWGPPGLASPWENSVLCCLHSSPLLNAISQPPSPPPVKFCPSLDVSLQKKQWNRERQTCIGCSSTRAQSWCKRRNLTTNRCQSVEKKWEGHHRQGRAYTRYTEAHQSTNSEAGNGRRGNWEGLGGHARVYHLKGEVSAKCKRHVRSSAIIHVCGSAEKSLVLRQPAPDITLTVKPSSLPPFRINCFFSTRL